MHRVLKRSAAVAVLIPAVTLLLAGHMVTVGPTTAYASDGGPTPTASCSADPSGLGCGVEGTTSTPTAGSGGVGTTSCTWKGGPNGNPAVGTWLTDAEWQQVTTWLSGNLPYHVGASPWDWMGVMFCPDPTVTAVVIVGVLPGGAPTPGNILGYLALSQVPWNPPSVGTSPPAGAPSVVHLPTYLYLNPGTGANPGAWQTFTTTAAVGGVSATVVAVPEEVVWTTDGDSVTCPGQGVPYNSAWGNSPAPVGSGACTYTYSDTSADQPGGTYSLSATVWYHATWTSTGAGGAAGDLGLVPGLTVTEQITVDQIASVITAG